MACLRLFSCLPWGKILLFRLVSLFAKTQLQRLVSLFCKIQLGRLVSLFAKTQFQRLVSQGYGDSIGKGPRSGSVRTRSSVCPPLFKMSTKMLYEEGLRRLKNVQEGSRRFMKVQEG